jgi:copper chaperone CopZ
MTSIYAVRAVETALTMVPGITSLSVSLGRVEATHDGGATAEDFRRAIALAGFEVAEVEEERRRLL